MHSFEDPSDLEANDLVAFGKGWLAYVNYPVKDETGNIDYLIGSGLSDEELCEVLVYSFATDKDYQRSMSVQWAEEDRVEGLMEALIAEYGEEEIMKYSSKEEISDNE